MLFLEWEFGNRDFGPIASRVKDAKPDFVWVGAIGLDGNLLLDAMKKIDYAPPQHFYLYPAPGPMTKSPEGDRALALDRGAFNTILAEGKSMIGAAMLPGPEGNNVRTYRDVTDYRREWEGRRPESAVMGRVFEDTKVLDQSGAVQLEKRHRAQPSALSRTRAMPPASSVGQLAVGARLDPAPNEAPERLETGTQNHEGIVGTAAAVDFLASLDVPAFKIASARGHAGWQPYLDTIRGRSGKQGPA